MVLMFLLALISLDSVTVRLTGELERCDHRAIFRWMRRYSNVRIRFAFACNFAVDHFDACASEVHKVNAIMVILGVTGLR